MPYSAQVFRVLIASPSDVSAERETIARVIQSWNDLNSPDRQIVLLPLRWETHSSPEFGKRPQEVINRQVVDQCDLLVGVFWTRIGTPTGEAASGTLEEIERVAKEGKPVMLYFSQAKQDPDAIDLDQLQELREFKKKTLPEALIETFSDQNDFRDKLTRQLDIQIRGLVASHTKDGVETTTSPPRTDIQLHFGDLKNGADLGDTLHLETTLITFDDFDTIPDYDVPAADALGSVAGVTVVSSFLNPQTNKDYYRQVASALIHQNLFSPLRFWLKNVGGIGARDVYIDLSLTSVESNFIVVPRARFPSSTPQPSTSPFPQEDSGHFGSPAELMANVTNRFRTQFEIQALQPQREISPPTDLFIGAISDATVTIEAIVYADTLPRPERLKLALTFTVTQKQLPVATLLESVG